MKVTLVTFFALFVRVNYNYLNIRFLSLVKYKKLDENDFFFTWKKK
jgi:hypothetical protein